MGLTTWLGLKQKKAAKPTQEDIARLKKKIVVPDEATITYDGATLHMRPKVSGVDQKLFLFGEYEPSVRHVIRRTLKPGGIAFDVGAHLGHHSATMRQCIGESGKLICIEPAPERLQLLEKNMAEFKNVKIIRSGLSSSESTAILSSGPNASPAITNLPNEFSINITTRTLPSIMDEFGIDFIDFIKMDIEGHECEALIGAAPRIHDVKNIVVEIHTDFIRDLYGEQKLEQMVEVLATFPVVRDLKHKMKRVKNFADKIKSRRRPQFLFSRS